MFLSIKWSSTWPKLYNATKGTMVMGCRDMRSRSIADGRDGGLLEIYWGFGLVFGLDDGGVPEVTHYG